MKKLGYSLLILVVYFWGYYNYLFVSKFEIYYLDVGQGDAIFLRIGKSKVLIDTGDKDSLINVMGAYFPPYLSSLDYVVITHLHIDHVGGLRKLVQLGLVDNLVKTEYNDNGDDYYYYDDVCSSVRCLSLEKQSITSIDIDNGHTLHLYNPKLSSNENNNSIICWLNTSVFTFLFMGDLEAEAEKDLIDVIENRIQNKVILKAGHHCSSTSSSSIFLDNMNVECAVCSVGKDNKYHHPSLLTIENLLEAGAIVYRTDIDGTIVITVYKNEINIKTY